MFYCTRILAKVEGASMRCWLRVYSSRGWGMMAECEIVLQNWTVCMVMVTHYGWHFAGICKDWYFVCTFGGKIQSKGSTRNHFRSKRRTSLRCSTNTRSILRKLISRLFITKFPHEFDSSGTLIKNRYIHITYTFASYTTKPVKFKQYVMKPTKWYLKSVE